jgi:MarR family transcriptional regulator, organic hydroperoxide resistance regulator
MSMRLTRGVPSGDLGGILKSRKQQEAPEPKASFSPPLTVSNPSLLVEGHDEWLRETLYLMVLTLSRLQTFRETFGRSIGLTSPQFVVLMGVAHMQRTEGISIGSLAVHVHLAPTHVTTEVGRLIRLGLLVKRPNVEDRRSVLVSLSPRGEEVVCEVTPLVRSVNDRLFAGMVKADIENARDFFKRFTANGELALAEIRHSAEALGRKAEDQ